jgi:hypothetical protein
MSRIYRGNITQGIGDNIMSKCFADQVKDKYDLIYFTHHPARVIEEKNNSPEYWNFLYDIGKLFFSDLPYVYNQGQHQYRRDFELIADFGIIPQKPQHSQFKHLLCKGKSLNLGEEYIVITTKIRYFDKPTLYRFFPQLWQVLRDLSKKYRIVVLGERVVEMCQDYRNHGSNQIYGIYEQIISNLPPERLLDLTIPALGISSPNLIQIQQDCLIMSEAKFVLTLGIGGNFVMAMAVANMVGCRDIKDREPIADTIFQRTYEDAWVSKDWNEFIKKLISYL